MSDHVLGPLLYPCANRVQIPQVGCDDVGQKQQQPGNQKLLSASLDRSGSASKDLIRNVSVGLSFSEDVVRDRCFHTLPFSNKYFHEALDVSELIPDARPPGKRLSGGRHNASGTDRRHMPCIEKPGSHRLAPLKGPVAKKASQLHQEAVDSGRKADIKVILQLINYSLLRNILCPDVLICHMIVLFISLFNMKNYVLFNFEKEVFERKFMS